MTITEKFDNADSDGSTVTTQAFELDDVGRGHVSSWVTIIDNGFDVDVDVTVQFTTGDDSEFNKFITDSDLENITVASGTRDGFGDVSNDPYSFIRFNIDPASDPTSGELTVTWQRRRSGGD